VRPDIRGTPVIAIPRIMAQKGHRMQDKAVLEHERILITGPAGRIAFPLAAELARDNEVWGIARFSDPASRQRVEQAGVRTRVVDLADPDFAGQPIPVMRGRRSLCNPIHERDINAQVPRLLQVASTPATVLNWAGDEAVDVETYCRYLGEFVGREPTFEPRSDAIQTFCVDNTRRRELIGDCRVRWREGFRDVIGQLHPEIDLPS
jgi:hypothetical protein